MKQSILLCLVFLSIASCSVIKPEKPAADYNIQIKAPEPSMINIPFELKVADLEKLLNNQFKGLIYEDNSYEDNGGDNLMVKAWKKEDFRISVDDNVLSYRIPLKLWIKAGWKIEKFGINLSDYREMNAEIALRFKTSMTVNPDWSITTTTASDGYEWLSTPVVKIGPVDISIKYLADIILKTNQKTINKEIDQAISDNLDLRNQVQDLWQTLQKPIQVNDVFHVWITLVPQQVYTTPIKGKAGIIRHTIGIKSITQAYVGKEPTVTPITALPKLTISNQPDNDFLINLAAELGYDKANEIASGYLKGKSFSQGKYHLLINTIDLYGRNNQFIIHLNVSGSLKGDLYFTGNPVFNDSTQSIEVQNLDYELKTRNALAKTGSWLFHSTLTRMIQKNMVFPLKEQLQAASVLMNESIKEYKISDDFYLTGSLKDLKPGDISLTPEAIRVNILLRGNVMIKMN